MHLTCSSGAQFVYFSSDSTVEDNSCHFVNICWKNVSNVSEKLFLENLVWNMCIWTASSEFGTYRLCEQRRFRRACASAESHQNLRCSLLQAVSQEESSHRKPDPCPPLNGWACAVKICHDGMLEDTNSLDGAHMKRYHAETFSFRGIIDTICGWIFCTTTGWDNVGEIRISNPGKNLANPCLVCKKEFFQRTSDFRHSVTKDLKLFIVGICRI